MVKGTRVRLTERGVKIHTAISGAHCGRVNWKDRSGRIIRICQDRKRAYVVWDGNRAASDAIPMTILEAIP